MEANQNSKPAELAAPPLEGYELRQKTHSEIAIESTDNLDLGLEARGSGATIIWEIKGLRAGEQMAQKESGRVSRQRTIPILLKLKM
jgi:hypothetical protein